MFTPFHTFAGSRNLERVITKLRGAGAVPIDIATAYETYHFSLLHKLQSAQYHVQTLANYLATQASAAHPATAGEIVYRVNFHFDGFTYVVGGALDILARELLSYFGIALPAQVYFATAHDQIAAHRAGDPILPCIAPPTWKAEFGDYRNTATHENIVGNEYQISMRVVGGKEERRYVFPLPDDPRANTRTYEHNPDIVVYCTNTFKRTLSLVNRAYDNVATRAKTAGALPL